MAESVNIPLSIIEGDDRRLLSQIDCLKNKAEKAKAEIMNGEFEKLGDNPDQDDILFFVTQFLNFVPDCALFPDEELINKLREYGFSKPVIKWFTPLDEILYKLKQLRDIDGAFFILNSMLFAISTYIQNKILVETIESFDLIVKHGKNEESNFLHKKFDNIFRRREYNKKKRQTGKMNDEERVLNLLIQNVERRIDSRFNFEDIILNSTQGKFDAIKGLISEAYFAPKISKNEIYITLYPILKIVFKDKVMLSEAEFNNLDELLYGGSYRKYQVSRVKKILSIG